jgi:hypothetical protein
MRQIARNPEKKQVPDQTVKIRSDKVDCIAEIILAG